MNKKIRRAALLALEASLVLAPLTLAQTFTGSFAGGGAVITGTGNNAFNGGGSVTIDTVTVGGPYYNVLYTSSANAAGIVHSPDPTSLVRYNSAGVMTASTTIPYDDQGDGMTLDSSGNIYVGAGSLEGFDNVATNKAWINKYSPGLALLATVGLSLTNTGNNMALASDGVFLYAVHDGDDCGFLCSSTDTPAKIVKYNSSLVAIATATYQIGTVGTTRMYGQAIDVDPAGNVYVIVSTGSSTGNNATYLVEYNNSLSGTPAAVDITTLAPKRQAVSQQGSAVYVSARNAAGNQFFVSKFSTGTLNYGLTFTQNNATSTVINGTSIRRSPDGTLVAGTSVIDGSGGDYLALKLDQNLDLLSSATYNGTSSGDDNAGALAVVDASHVMMTGASENGSGGYDAVTLELTLPSAATPSPTFSFTGGFGSANGADIAASGGYGSVGYLTLVDTNTAGGPFVYVSFLSTTTPLSEGGFDPDILSLVRYDSSGNFLSSATLGGTHNGDGMTQDSSGNIYIAAGNDTSGGNVNWIEKYTKTLAFVSSATLNTSDIGDLQWDGADIYAHADGLNSNSLLVKLTPSLAVVSSATYAADSIAGEALDGAGNIFVAATNGQPMHLLKYPVSFANNASPALDVAVSTTLLPNWSRGNMAVVGGNLYVAAMSTQGATNPAVYVRRFDSGLQYSGISSTFTDVNLNSLGVSRLQAGPDGNIYLVTTGGAGETPYASLQYSPSLVLLSSAVFGGVNGHGGSAVDMAVQDSSHVYVTGTSCGNEGGTNCQAATVLFSLNNGAAGGGTSAPVFSFTGNFGQAGGAQIAATLNGSTANAVGYGIVADTLTAGGPYEYTLFASTTGSIFQSDDFLTTVNGIAKYDSTGVLLASATVASAPASPAKELAIDAADNVYVAERVILSTDCAVPDLDTLYKFDKNLVFVASAVVSNTLTNGVKGIVSDGTFVYLDGYAACGLGNTAAVIKYDANLNQVASALAPTPYNEVDRGGLALDGSGNVYLLAGSSSTAGISDYALMQFASGLTASISPVSVTASSLFTTRGKNPQLAASANDLYAVQMDSAGAKLYAREFDSSLNYTGNSATFTAVNASTNNVVGGSIRVGADGDVYIVSVSTEIGAVRLSPSLVRLSSASTPVNGAGLFVEDAGDVFISGALRSGGLYDSASAKLNLSGSGAPVFSFTGNFGQAGGAQVSAAVGGVPANTGGKAVAMDTVTAGGPYEYMIFSSSSGPAPFSGDSANGIVKYGPAGVFIASTTLSGQAGGAFVRDSAGNLYVGEKIQTCSDDSCTTPWIDKFNKNLVFMSSVAVSNVAVGNIDSFATDGTNIFSVNDGGTDNIPKVIEYNSSLTPVATATYANSDTPYSRNGEGIALDGSGNLYAVVESTQASPQHFRILEYPVAGLNGASPEANVDVTSVCPVLNSSALAYAGGSLFAACTSTDSTQVYAVKFDADIDFLASSTFTVSPPSSNAYANMKAGPDGMLYVVTASTGLGVLRLDQNLALQTAATSVGGYDIAVKDSSDVFIAGLIAVGSVDDAMLAKLDLSGFVNGIVSVSGGFSAPGGVTAARSGASFVGADIVLDTTAVNGPAVYLLAGGTYYQNAPVILKLNSTGALISSAAVAAPGTAAEMGRLSLSPDAADNIYAVGWSSNTGAGCETAGMVQYSPSLSSATHFEACGSGAYRYAIPAGNFVFVGNERPTLNGEVTIRKFNTGLQQLTTAQFLGSPYSSLDGMAVDQNNQFVYLEVTTQNGNQGDPRALLKYDFNLDFITSAAVTSTILNGAGLTVDNAGNLFAAYTNNTTTTAYIAKYSANLALLGSVSYPNTGQVGLGVQNADRIIRTAPDGTLYSTWEKGSGAAGNYLLLQNDPDTLAMISSRTYDSGSEDGAMSVAVSTSFAYVTGAAGNPVAARTLRFPLAAGAGTTVGGKGLFPLNGLPAAGAAGVSTITWTWGAFPDVAAGFPTRGYIVLSPDYNLSNFSSIVGAVSGKLPPTTTSYLDVGLASNTAAGRVIAAYNDDTSRVMVALSALTTAYTLAAPPQDLSFLAVNATTATLAWGVDGNSVGTRYLVSWWGMSGSTATATTVTVAPSTSTTIALATYTVAGLLANTTFTFNVRAENGAAPVLGRATAFDPTVAVSTQMLPSRPTVAPAITMTIVDSATVRWNWAAVVGADAASNYLLYPSTGGVLSTSATSFILTGLMPGTSYYARVQAQNASGVGPLATSAVGYTLAAPPQGLAFDEVSITSATFIWNSEGNPPGTKYVLSYWNVRGGTTSATVSPADPSVDVSTITGLVPNEAYTFNVQAKIGSINRTAFDPTVAISTLTAPLKPTSAPVVTAVGTDTATVRFSWSEIGHFQAAQWYLFYPSTGGNPIMTTDTFLSIATTAANGLVSGKIQAVNVTGAGPLSATATGYSLADAPVNLSTTAINVTSMTVTWGGQNNALGTKYIVSRWIAGKTTTTATVATTSATLTGLTANTLYQINVQAENGQIVKTVFAGQIAVKTRQTDGALSLAVKGWPYGGRAMKFSYAGGESFSVGMKTVSRWKAADAAEASLNTTGTAVLLSLPPGLDGEGSFKIFTRAAVPVRELDLGELTGGFDYYLEWDGKDEKGAAVAPGAYYGIFTLPGVAQNALVKFLVTAPGH